MIHIVSGSQRTGTSMMMRALIAGGMGADFDPARNQMNRYGDEHYRPNRDGFYELSREQYRAAGFPRAHEGKLIKVLNEGVLTLAPGDYRVVFMRRDPEEMRQSWQAFFGPRAVHPAIERQDDIEGALRMRRDCQVTTLWYRDVVDSPLEAFERLGWCDAEKAAATIDPGLCHMKREELAVGI